ncbi:YggS family pyridoxal phosphate-dependent enzyme [Limnobacter parvus]|uniref:Pyridoxal phosphate homeostasis protein n=1 Tax=Limnobacter parvus TaxID=2939690 RepID=A0ABT1XKC1_9BURK|nr:YggS family pyridoxal phosphate-dependent enzyme [Limnobacter parvus]MCR2747743.1 YggS family pyridoxal phosphate-dependent enzyme [Limnobacter parvus]
MSRADQLADIQKRIAMACAKAGRATDAVQLLAVSKTFPLSDVLEFHACGQTTFGENYLQEALDKITQLADHPNAQQNTPAIEWHFIGPIQSNKTKPIAENFPWVHSVDRLKIAQRLSDQRPSNLPALNVLVQINTSGEDSKSGVEPADAVELCKTISALPNLKLRGLMTIPSNTENTDQLKAEFLQCKTIFDELNNQGLKLDTLSMGMSADLELAIECGSTCVRVGSALFGARSYPK